MKRKGNIGLGISCLAALILVLSSCFKEDKKVMLPAPGQNQISTVTMGLGYKTEVFFGLTNGVVLSNEFAAWDLAFESSSAGYHIWMSGGKGMLIANMNSNHFVATTDTGGASWRWDEASWNPDSTAVGNWVSFVPKNYEPVKSPLRTDGNQSFSNGEVFIVDRGSNYTTDDTRFFKIVFESVSPSAYTFKWATLGNTYTDSIILQKNQNENYTYFTFDNGGAPIVMEPAKNSWEILFTRYRHIFYDTNPITPYLVTGALINNVGGVKAAVDSIQPYEKIDYSYAKNLVLSSNREKMGYDWKTYSFTTQSYTMKNYSYIIKDNKGFYWKLKFIDFYNDQGEEGYPKFEYQRL